MQLIKAKAMRGSNYTFITDIAEIKNLSYSLDEYKSDNGDVFLGLRINVHLSETSPGTTVVLNAEVLVSDEDEARKLIPSLELSLATVCYEIYALGQSEEPMALYQVTMDQDHNIYLENMLFLGIPIHP